MFITIRVCFGCSLGEKRVMKRKKLLRCPRIAGRSSKACLGEDHAVASISNRSEFVHTQDSMSLSRCITIAVLMLLACHVGRASASTTFNVIDLGTLGGSYSLATAINGSGEIVGEAYLAGDSAYQTALWTNSSATAIDLGTLGGANSQANSVNASGQVVGLAFMSNAVQHAALWTNVNGTAIDLGTLGGTSSQANGINAAGQIVGSATTTGDVTNRAALWTNASSPAIDLGTLGGTSSEGNGINASGQVVGSANTTGDVTTHAALWTNSNSAPIDLGTLGGSRSRATGLMTWGGSWGNPTQPVMLPTTLVSGRTAIAPPLIWVPWVVRTVRPAVSILWVKWSVGHT